MVTESEKSKHDILRAMRKHICENGKVVTDEMIADWESALERDEWPSGWVNVGEIVEGKLPKAAPETVTLSLKVPVAMKRALEKEAKAEGKSTGAYARGILADGLRHSIADFRRLSRNTSTGVFIREEVEPVDGFTSEKGIGT